MRVGYLGDNLLMPKKFHHLKIQNDRNVATFKETTKTWKIIFLFLSSNIFKRQIVQMGPFCFPDSWLHEVLNMEIRMWSCCHLGSTSLKHWEKKKKNLHRFWDHISLKGFFLKRKLWLFFGCARVRKSLAVQFHIKEIFQFLIGFVF